MKIVIEQEFSKSQERSENQSILSTQEAATHRFEQDKELEELEIARQRGDFEAEKGKEAFLDSLKQNNQAKLNYLLGEKPELREYLNSNEAVDIFGAKFESCFYNSFDKNHEQPVSLEEIKYLLTKNSDFIQLYIGGNIGADIEVFRGYIHHRRDFNREKTEYLLEKHPAFNQFFEIGKIFDLIQKIIQETDRKLNKELIEYLLEKCPTLTNMLRVDSLGGQQVFESIYNWNSFSKDKIECLLEINPDLSNLFNYDRMEDLFIRSFDRFHNIDKDKIEYLLEKHPSFIELFNSPKGKELFLSCFDSGYQGIDKDKIKYLLEKNPSFIELFSSPKGKELFLSCFEGRYYNIDKDKVEYLLETHPSFIELFNSPKGKELFLSCFDSGYQGIDKDKIKYLLEVNPSFIELFNGPEGKKLFLSCFESGYHNHDINQDRMEDLLEVNPSFIELFNSPECREWFLSCFNDRGSCLNKNGVKYLLEKNPDLAEDLKEHISAVFYTAMARNDYAKAHFILIINIKYLNEGMLHDYNINYKDSEGNRIIDKAQQLYEKAYNNETRDKELGLIIDLRNLGSVEPVNFIESKGNPGKIDLNVHPEGVLDTYRPNIVNAPKIIKKLFAKYPLTEYQIDQEINYFKEKNFEGLLNTEWGLGTDERTIKEVIDELCKMRNIDIVNLASREIDFKKVLATIICVARTSGNNEMEHTLTLTLQGLKECSFGKLLNLLYIAQDSVAEDNFNSMTMQEVLSLYETSFAGIEYVYNDDPSDIASAIYKWATEIVIGKAKPEEWSLDTCKIQGILNQFLLETSGREKITSEHYVVLKDELIPRIIDLIRSDRQLPDPLLILKEAYELGIKLCLEELVEKIIKNPENMELLFDHIYQNAELNFSHFQTIKLETIQTIYAKVLEEAPELAGKILGLLQENLTFSDEVEKFINQTLKLENIHSRYIKESLTEVNFLNQMLQGILDEDAVVDDIQEFLGEVTQKGEMTMHT